MRVLFVTHNNGLFGANRSMLQLILELREQGIIPMVLLPKVINNNPNNSLKERLQSYGINYIETSIRAIKHPEFWKVLPNYIYSFFCKRKVSEDIKNLEFDIVHSNSSVIDIGAYIAKKRKVPHIWHLREFGDLDYNMYTPFGKWFQRIIYHGNNEFIAISNKIAEHYRNYIQSDRVHIIYNGINEFNSLSTNEKTLPIKFCITGLLHPKKGQFDAIKAVRELVKMHNLTEFHLSIIGTGDEKYLNDMREYITRHALTPFITFLGQRNDVPELLSKMDVGIMCSTSEAFGRVTVEYMMAGLAVIASDGGANKEIIEHATEGLIYPTGNYVMLAEQMAELINNPSKIIRLARGGYQKAIKEFSSKTNTLKIASLYRTVL